MLKEKEHQMDKAKFEKFIMDSCKSQEWNLRGFLKRVLKKNGFQLIEDNYRSRRGDKFAEVHNLLAIKGSPKVCLVAHTDVCRDHAGEEMRPVPVIKEQNGKRYIQDRDCMVQVGGDDRLGVAINTYYALNTHNDIALLFTTDEETGAISADYLTIPEVMDFELLLQVDRGNHSNQLVNFIGGVKLCNEATTRRLINISNEIGYPRTVVNGMLTDVMAIKGNGMCKNAVNITCGYHSSYGAGSNEYISVDEAIETFKYVEAIVDYYAANKHLDEPEIIENIVEEEDDEDDLLLRDLFSDEEYAKYRNWDA